MLVKDGKNLGNISEPLQKHLTTILRTILSVMPTPPTSDKIPLRSFITVDGCSPFVFLRIALSIVQTLEKLHRSSGIHGSINPDIITINSETFEADIMEASAPASFASMAPEQTGRLAMVADRRTDFYAVGITFYELLTGLLPFEETDPYELIYCQIAIVPVSPSDVNPTIPLSLSKIVMKLLAKSPDYRYQSAVGIHADLERSLRFLESTGEIPAFEPGENDVSPTLRIPAKLYGREHELSALMGAFRRICNGGKELLLVSGYSGVGKTSLVNEVRLPILKERGFFISGKFDQLSLGKPYSALVGAFEQLIRRLLGEGGRRTKFWKGAMLEQLGKNLRLIADFIPTIELITGSLEEVPEVPPLDAENRLLHTFSLFVRVFTEQAPMTLFIDDLQWVDRASLTLLKHLVADNALSRLLIIGSFRDNETPPSHPLHSAIAEMAKSYIIINRILLLPLDINAVSDLLKDTLFRRDGIAQLADLVIFKTDGNPFFVRQFIMMLYEKGLLRFDDEIAKWEWDQREISRQRLTDNLADLLVGKLSTLLPDTIELLTTASCIGARFDLPTIALVLERDVSELATSVAEALQQQFIGGDSEAGYFFMHDSFQQAAISLISKDRYLELHLKIGRTLLKAYGSTDRLFDVVNHLNAAVSLITDLNERLELAQLNLEAGRNARHETAYDAAGGYFAAGCSLLPEDCWTTHRELSFTLHLALAEAEYLRTHFAEAERLYDLLGQKAATKLEKVQLCSLRVVLYESAGRTNEANAIGLEGLKGLGTDLKSLPLVGLLMFKLAEVKLLLFRTDHQGIMDLPKMSDPEKLAAITLLAQLIPSAYFVSKNLVATITLEMVRLSLKYGNAPVSPYAYAAYAVFEGSILGNYRQGYDFGLTAIGICNRTGNQQMRIKTDNIFGAYNSQWRRHINEAIPYLADSYRLGKEYGDLRYASFSGSYEVTAIFFKGERLEVVAAHARKHSHFCLSIHDNQQNYIQLTLLSITDFLRGIPQNFAEYFGEGILESPIETTLKSSEKDSITYIYYTYKIYYLFLSGQVRDALKLSRKVGGKIDDYLLGQVDASQFNFFYALCILSCFHTVTAPEKPLLLLELYRCRRKMKIWAENCPENFLHKLLLIDAEICRLRKQKERAISLYKQSIASALEHGFVNNEALGNELAGRFCLQNGLIVIGAEFIVEAYGCYVRWGATALAKRLATDFPVILDSAVQTTQAESEDLSQPGSVINPDVNSVVRASQSINATLDLDQLLRNLLRIVIHNAGAERGVVIMEKSGSLQVVAQGTSNDQEITVSECIARECATGFPATMVHLATSSSELIIVNGNSGHHEFSDDPYLAKDHPLSMMCIPLTGQGRRIVTSLPLS